MQFIYQLSQSQTEDHREMAFIILLEISETLGKALKPQFPTLKMFYLNALQDKSRKVCHQLSNTYQRLRLSHVFACDNLMMMA